MKKHLLSTDRLRLANALRDRLAALRCEQLGAAGRQLDSLLAQLGRVEASRRRLGLCLDRRWQAAGRRAVEEMRSVLRDLPYYTDQAGRAQDWIHPRTTWSLARSSATAGRAPSPS